VASYATIEDLEKQIPELDLIQLTDDEGTGAADEARLSRALSDASEEIDSYLGSRMELPISPVPPVLRKYAVDMAVHNLYARRPDMARKTVRERYRDAVRFLERVAEGKISLGAKDPSGTPASDAPAYVATERVMTDERMSRF